MKRIWRFLRGRRARVGPVSSGSSGGNELQPEGLDELRQEAATSDLSPVQPLVKQRDRKCQDRDDRHSPDAWPVDPWEQESEGEAAPGQAKEVSASSAPHGAGAAGVTLLSPTWWSTDELAVYLESALPKLQADEEATEEIKSFGGEMCELSAQLELESEISLQLEARNQELRELVALLPHRLATPEEGHATTALYGKQWEQRAQEADREMRGLTPRLQTQAAAQARREEIKTTDTSWKEPLMQTIRVLTWDLERAWSMQEETARQLAEIKSSK
ncbi:uncharacterized protein LOC142604744 isoform X1 [Balearica regulorum gibbericeps]|uniref:uncharacterized protein LOC142604744 isoform X1 n=1 Tax=Balearica regulorum gibbericeps TaxID=100784 RepID=UPI003F61BDD0